MRRVRASVALLFLASGATALVYQVAWSRDLTLVLGAGHDAVALLLAAFMAGLALGGWLLGRLSPIARPLRVYAWLELGVAASALLLPVLLDGVSGTYVAAARSLGDGAGIGALRAITSFAVLLAPTFFMGGTLPVLTQYVTRRREDFGRGLAGLYGINTLGAVLGTLAGGFWLLPAVGVWRTELVAAGTNLAVALVALALDRRERTTATDEPVSTWEPTPPTSRADLVSARLAFLSTAVAGGAALALEVTWTRAISIAAGTTTYSFTVMLATFLIGIGLGSVLHAAFPLRRIDVRWQLGFVLVLVGLGATLASHWIPHLPLLVVRINRLFYGDAPQVGTATVLFACFAVALLPCIGMGMAFPLAGRARATHVSSAGRAAGDVVGLNTLGAICGSLGAGFVLIPALGLQSTMLAVAGIYIVWGVLVLGATGLARAPHARPGARFATAAAAVLGLVAGVVLPLTLPRWNVARLGAFRTNLIGTWTPEDGVEVERWLAATHVLDYREGRNSIVSVVDHGGARSLIVMGKAVASDGRSDVQHELLLGHLPALVHPDPRSAVVIGLGAGITAGAVAAHPGIERLLVVEIEPAVVEAARWFGAANGNVLDDPRLEIVIGDGRNHLLTTRERFDVITADPIHPWAAGATYLYTGEYYRLARQRLTDGGVMCQWLPLYEMSADDLVSVVRAFRSAFPSVTVWQTTADALLIGTEHEIALDLDRLARRMASGRVATDLAGIGLADPLSFAAELALDAEGVDRHFGLGPINTDDNLRLEFSAPRSIGLQRLENMRELDRRRVNPVRVVARPEQSFGSLERATEQLARYARAKSETVASEMLLIEVTTDRFGFVAEQASGRLRRVVDELPEYGRARFLLGVALTRLAAERRRADRLEDELALLEEALAADPLNPDARTALGHALLTAGRAAEAEVELARAWEARPTHAATARALGTARLELGRAREAVAPLAACVNLRARDASTRVRLGRALLLSGRPVEAVQAFEDALDVDPDNHEARVQAGLVLLATGYERAGVAVLEEALRRRPDHVPSALRFGWALLTTTDAELRDPERALALARATETAAGERATVLDLVAAATAACGSPAEAAPIARRAAEVARANGREELARTIDARRASYLGGGTADGTEVLLLAAGRR